MARLPEVSTVEARAFEMALERVPDVVTVPVIVSKWLTDPLPAPA